MKRKITLIFLLTAILIPGMKAGNNGTGVITFTVPDAEVESLNASFTAVKSKHGIEFSWNAGSYAVEVFTIERTKDSVHFETVSVINGFGRTSLQTQYLETDYTALNEHWLYRLQTTFYNGEKRVSSLVNVGEPVSEKGILKHFKRKNYLEELDNKEALMVLKDKDGKEQYSKFILLVLDNELVAVDIERRVNPGKYKVVATSINRIYGKKLEVK